MEFGKHLGKGIWGFADKSLPPVYGVAFMFLVIRVLPVEEYGAYFLIQNMFMIISSLAFSFAIQPMLKFVAEGFDARVVSSTALTLLTFFIAIILAALLIIGRPVAVLLDARHAEEVRSLFLYLPLMFLASVYRVISSGLLQARLKIRELFWVDLVYFVTSVVLILAARMLGILNGAVMVVYILIGSSLLASVMAIILARDVAVPIWRWDGVMAKKIFSYGKFGVGGTLGNVVQTQFDTFFVSMYGGVGGVAMYGVAKNFARMFDMYSQVIQMLVLPASSILQGRGEEKKLTGLVEKSVCFSFYAIIPVIFLFGVFPAPIFRFFYGHQYTSSIPVLQILCLTGFMIPFGAVVASTLYGIGKITVGFIMSMISLVLSVCLYALFGHLWGMYGIVWSVVMTYVILTSLGVIVLNRYVPFTVVSVFRRTQDVIVFVRNRLSRLRQ